MRKINFISLLYIFFFLLSLFFVQPAFAHGDEPRLEISVERINPGGTVDVRGVDLGSEELVVLSLVGSEVQIPLQEVTTDVEGTFTQIIVLPADLPTGEYNFMAASDHHQVTSPTFTVWGAAIENEESSSVQEQSDLALGPLPTFSAGVSSTPVPQSAVPETPVSKINSISPLYAILAAVGILALLGIRLLKKR